MSPPPGRRAVDTDTAWPLPHQDVLGDRNTPRAWVEYALFRILAVLGAWLPAAGRRLLAGGIARAARTFERRHSNPGRAFIAQAFGDQLDAADRERLLLAAWRHLAEMTLENAAFDREVLGSRLRSHFDVELSTDAATALEQRSGGFFVGPHLGYWEALPPLLADLGFRPLYVVARPPKNRPLSRYAQRIRESRGFHLIARDGAVSAMTAVVKANGWVGLLLDQRARGKTVLAPFFGRLALCERAIPVIAGRLKRPIIFCACYGTGRPFHYRAVIDRVMWPDEIAALDAPAIATAINREIERQILFAPEQYLWLHNRYHGAAAGSA